MDIKLKENLNVLLEGENLTRLSERLGIPKSLLSDWKNGKSPSMKNINHVVKISDHFDVSLRELFFGSKSSKRNIICTSFFDSENSNYKLVVEKLNLEKDET